MVCPLRDVDSTAVAGTPPCSSYEWVKHGPLPVPVGDTLGVKNSLPLQVPIRSLKFAIPVGGPHDDHSSAVRVLVMLPTLEPKKGILRCCYDFNSWQPQAVTCG